MNTKNISEAFLKDMQNEEKFQALIPNMVLAGMDTELIAAIRVYNEQIDQLTRHRFDVELYGILAISDPNGGSDAMNPTMNWGTRLHDMERLIANRRTTIRIIREHIVQLVAKRKKEKKK